MHVANIKLFGMGARRPDMTLQDFQDYWRHPHGTWGRRMLSLRGYVQSHAQRTALLGPEQDRFDFVAEMWLDSERDLREFQNDPIYVQYLQDDGPRFLDMSTIVSLATEEEVLTRDPPPSGPLNSGDEMWSLATRPVSVKLLHFAGHDRANSWAGKDDADLGRNMGALRHVRCRPLGSFHGDSAPFAGVHELWWPTARAFREGVERGRVALDALIGKRGESVTLLAQAERLL
jgi:uncharacterized protein (TIGR02118 family)